MTRAAGQVTILLEEADYAYGIGQLRLRVERIDRTRRVTYLGEIWYPVSGVEIAWDGAEVGRREVLVRAGRLPPA